MPETIDTDRGPSQTADGGGRWRTIGVVIGLFIAGPIVANILGAIPIIVLALQGTSPGDLPASVLLIGQVIVDGTYLLVAGLYVHRWLGGSDIARPDSREWRWIGLGLAATLVVWLTTNGLGQVLSIEPPTSAILTVYDEQWAFVAFTILATTLVPVAEEALFRGAIQRRLRIEFGPWVAIGGASLAFLSIHLLNFTGGSIQALGLAFATLFFVSVALGYVYERTDNLVVPVCVHIGYNGILFGLSLSGVLG